MRRKSPFGLFARFSRNKTSVATTGVAVGTSGVVTQISQSKNSSAMSKNLQAASVELHDYLETIDDDVSAPPDATSMSRWIEKTARYSNSSYEDGALLKVALIPSSHHAIIDLAAVCSKLVYGGTTTSIKLVHPDRFVSEGPALNLAPDALFGTVKATSIRLLRLDLTGKGLPTPVIVVAIRGTVPIRDWAVNLNHNQDKTETTDFLGRAEANQPYRAHAGFLESARQTAAPLADSLLRILLDSCLSDSPAAPQLLLTGHSAGGAVASMLYAHMSSLPGTQDQAPRSSLQTTASKFSAMHLVTFGAPPVTSPPIAYPKRSAHYAQGSCESVPHQPAFYAIVNEGDPIPRCDDKYIGALLRVFVSVSPSERSAPPSSSLTSQFAGISVCDATMFCDLPKMELRNAGKLLLIRKSIQSSLTTDKPRLWDIPNDGEGSLESMLFGNPRLHPMRVYLERLRLADKKLPLS
ncbi:hypothetical protein QQS21_006032 [Conoideocrella luteorostrata]|uniref:sn-1-specific diacylglycerol lipase n=1 Tax=Conoideocrella luteorostrata TaxID=1105319 RepID=A0AAJ0CNA2_9HYPO|nr:hypothetical protein QQS21_006032 [Conoideocrella luteorostrata]